MITRRSFRSFAVAVTVAALIVAGIAIPASAKKPAHAGRQAAIVKVEKVKPAKADKAATRKAAANARKAAAKARQAARVVATGAVVAVGADTLTVAVDGGTKSLRGTESVFTVATDALVNRDDAPATLADVVAGDHVAVKGTRDGSSLVASMVNASSPEPVVDEPTENVDEIVTEDPTEDTGGVTEDPTENPTETVTDEPTETVVF